MFSGYVIEFYSHHHTSHSYDGEASDNVYLATVI